MTQISGGGRLPSGAVRTVSLTARRYATAIAAVAITVLVKLVVDGLGTDHPFVLLPVPVAVAAWYGGRGPGLLSVALVAIAGMAFVGRSLFDDGGDVIALTVVVVEGIIVVGITVALRSALRRAEESTARRSSRASARPGLASAQRRRRLGARTIARAASASDSGTSTIAGPRVSAPA